MSARNEELQGLFEWRGFVQMVQIGSNISGRGRTFAAAIFWLMAPIAGFASEQIENNVDRPGSDYSTIKIGKVETFLSLGPEFCQERCLADNTRCRAWTYVRPGVRDKRALCILREAAPAPVSDSCCVSGVVNGNTDIGQTPDAKPVPSAPQATVPPAASERANEPYGSIGVKYAGLGGPRGALGAPVSGEADAPHGGRCQQFQSGMICWHPEIGEAFGVWGAIYSKWAAAGGVEFGYPVIDERVTSDGRGRYVHVRGVQYPDRPEASIFWTPQTGAHTIYGAIRDAWAKQGWERGPLGYPISDEYQSNTFRRVNFEGGYIRWAPDTGIEVRKR